MGWYVDFFVSLQDDRGLFVAMSPFRVLGTAWGRWSAWTSPNPPKEGDGKGESAAGHFAHEKMDKGKKIWKECCVYC